mgnify:CR=1 FL=1
MLQVLRLRAKAMEAIRQFFSERDFLEVETPAMQPIYGGANGALMISKDMPPEYWEQLG